MYLTIAKILFALFLIGKINCKIEETDSQLHHHNAAIGSKSTLDITNLDELLRRYVHLRAFIEHILDTAEEEQQQQQQHSEDLDAAVDTSVVSFLKRASVGGGESGAYERYMKGKRVNNKNMFSSGLQGVWGVPGRK